MPERNSNFSVFWPSKLLRQLKLIRPVAVNSCSLATLVGADIIKAKELR